VIGGQKDYRSLETRCYSTRTTMMNLHDPCNKRQAFALESLRVFKFYHMSKNFHKDQA
jgi:hypothetical protein